MYTSKQFNLLKKFANLSDELFDLGVIETDSFTGEIGEYYACKLFNLNKTKRVTRAVDGIDNDGKKYQVKAKVVSDNFNYIIKKLENELFDFLIVVYLDQYYSVLKVLKIESNLIKDSQISITKSNINLYEVGIPKKVSITNEVKNTIKLFAESYLDLERQGIIRSRRIVGDLGEFYAAARLDLILSTKKNEKGIDARDKSGQTFEIKTRRVYSSGRRISETRRINNLEGKYADYLVVVTLNRSFQCSGMWIMPTKNIVNPKQAKLQIVNTTPETYTLITSSIPWLYNREPYEVITKSSHKELMTKKPQLIKIKANDLKTSKSKKVKKKILAVTPIEKTSLTFSWELIVIGLIILFITIVMISIKI